MKHEKEIRELLCKRERISEEMGKVKAGKEEPYDDGTVKKLGDLWNESTEAGGKLLHDYPSEDVEKVFRNVFSGKIKC